MREFGRLYGPELFYNIHRVGHLAEECLVHGPLDTFSAFCFKSYLSKMKGIVRSLNKPLAQISRRLSMLLPMLFSALHCQKYCTPGDTEPPSFFPSYFQTLVLQRACLLEEEWKFLTLFQTYWAHISDIGIVPCACQACHLSVDLWQIFEQRLKDGPSSTFYYEHFWKLFCPSHMAMLTWREVLRGPTHAARASQSFRCQHQWPLGYNVVLRKVRLQSGINSPKPRTN